MEPNLIGPYQIQDQLGEGGAGAVFRARDVRDGREVAIKLLLRPTAQRMGRFQLEAATLARLRHPNVVPVLDYGIANDGRPYLVLELIQGQTLQRRLETRGPLPPDEAVQVTQQLAAALAAAHAQDLLHRDVKPENVLLRAADGAAILSDFGLAKELGSQLERLTQTGAIMGTPGFLAPEQLGSSQLHSPALDVYGVGATLYAMLTGEPPVTGSTAIEVFQATLTRPVTPPSHLGVVPPALEAVCLRCLAKDPSERYPDASALLDALDLLDAGVKPASWSRHPLLLFLPALVLLGGALGWQLSRPPDAPPSPPTTSASASPTLSAVETPLALPSLSPSASPTPPSSRELADLIERGDRALALHQPEADELVREAYRLAPEHAQVCLNMAFLALRHGKREEAWSHVQRALELDRDLAAAYSLRAQIHLYRRDLASAKRDLERALSLNPKSNTAWATLGKIRARELDFKGARAAFDKAVAIHPGPLHLADRAALYAAVGKLQEARIDAERAVKIGPQLAHPWVVRGQIKRAQGDSSALADYDRAIAIEPDDLDALAGRAKARMDVFRYRDAIQDLTRFLALVPDHSQSITQEVLADRGVAYLYSGDPQTGLRDLEALARANPKHPVAQYWLSEAHYRLGDFEAAEAAGRRSLAHRESAIADKRIPRNQIPGLSRSLLNLARVQRLGGDPERALETLTRSIMVAHPRDPYPRLWAVAWTGDRKFVETWPDPDPWPRPIGDYFLGTLAASELLAKAEAKSPRAICQVRTFMGIEAERRGAQSQARAHYRAAVETGLGHLDEFAWAQLRLAGR